MRFLTFIRVYYEYGSVSCVGLLQHGVWIKVIPQAV